MSKIVSILDEKGYLMKISLLCTYSYKNRDYAVFRYGDQDRIYAKEILSDSWCETVVCGNRIEETEKRFARILSERNRENSEKYPLNGEHYSIYERTTQEGEKVTKVSRRNGKCLFTPMGRFFSALLKMLFSLFFAAYFGGFYYGYNRFFTLELFPQMSSGTVVRLIFFISMGGAAILFFVCRRRRTVPNLLINSFLPLSLLSVAVGISKILWMRILFVVTIIVSVTFLVLHREREQWGETLKFGVYRIYSSFAVPLLAMGLVVMAGAYSGVFKAEVQLNDVKPPREVWENYRSVLNKLDSDEWESLSLDEIEEVLGTISEYECVYVLGIDPVSVTVTDIGDEILHGAYNDELREIKINERFVSGSGVTEVLTTLLHETRHAWQFKVAEMYDAVKPHLSEDYKVLSIIRDGIAFEKSICDPYTVEATYEHYLSTALEQDARRWSAAQLLTEYMKYITVNQK